MKVTAILGVVFVIAGSVNAAVAPPPPAGTATELLWSNGAPGALGNSDADKPVLTTFALPPDKANGTAVIVCPGGGYQGHAMDYEGYEVAQWLNSNGITAFVLRYRVAPYRHPAPLQDAQRAIRLVRSRAAELGIEKDRIGILGFSAGGHLASTASTHYDAGQPDATDAVDRQSCRPNFSVLVYPVITMRTKSAHSGSRDNLLGKDYDEALAADLSNDEKVTRETPPAFLVHSTADTVVPAENSVQYYLACRKAGVRAEMHVYERGRHGYGMGKGDPVLSTWPGLCAEWMKALFHETLYR